MATRKLTQNEMDKALELAEAMRDKGKDKYSLGHAVMYLHERNELLENLRQRAERYVRFGMADKELTDLRVLLDKLRETDVVDADDSSLFSRD